MNKRKENSIEQSMGRIVNFRPVFSIACFLILGILVGYLRIVDEQPIWIAVLIVLVLPLVAGVLFRGKTRFIAYLVLFYLFFCIGFTSFSLATANHRDSPTFNGEYVVCGTVVEKNVQSYGGEVVLTNLSIGGEEVAGKLTFRLYDGDFAAVDFCDRITASMQVNTANAVEGAYGFRAEAIANRELYRGSEPTWYRVDGVEFRLGAFVRGRLQNALYTGMSEENAAVAVAILLGNTSGIEEGLLENVRYGGVAHIFAVSGLHIGAAFAFCLLLFRGKRIPAPIRFLFIAAILLLYGGVCGYSASVVRATVTCLVLYGCSLLGMKYDGLESLSLAACVVLLIYPTLLFGVGAQLSFGACLGIVLLSRPLNRVMGGAIYGVFKWVKHTLLGVPKPPKPNMFKGNTLPKPLPWQAVDKAISFLSVSMAAQLATAPILYLSFGYFSVISRLVNCLFVPMITLGFSPLLVFAMVGAFFPPSLLPTVFYLPNLLLGASTLLFHIFDFSSGVIRELHLLPQSVICYYAALIFCTDKINFCKWQKRTVAATFAVCCIITLL
ncbi:MAG: ComEC/Rec2 family competence protein [Clostridia bacterium]|nr:ComEC/Rec2 family competence protein [Clostridia bacterium]